jgi:flagellar basal-body rod protein FlgB
MIDPIFQSDNYQLARKLLDASVLRHEAIASNIAHVDTPGYRRLDLSPDFAAELRRRLDSGDLKTTADTLKPALIEDPRARIVRPDGNTIELEQELLELNRNTVEHEYLTELVSRNIKQMKLAITGRPV